MRATDLAAGLNLITGDIVDLAIDVHRELGPNLFERTYQLCLSDELQRRGRKVESEVEVPLTFRGRLIDKAFRLDLLVDDQVIVEVKTVDMLHRAHFAQVQTYLRLANKPVGLLLNFNAVPMKTGIRRLVGKPMQ